jgi:tRNA/rRNA methyltransferase
MIAPAARAALMAMLSMGCSACDMGQPGWARERAGEEKSGGRRTQCGLKPRHFTAPGYPHAILAANTPAPDPTRFVLINTSHPGNVGAAARAMKVMGFDDLVLVAPRFADVLSQRRDGGHGQRRGRHPGARARGAPGRGAGRHHLRLRHGDDAARLRPAHRGAARPLPALAAQWPPAPRVAFVFGSERFGMANDDVYRCHACLSSPRTPTTAR